MSTSLIFGFALLSTQHRIRANLCKQISLSPVPYGTCSRPPRVRYHLNLRDELRSERRDALNKQESTQCHSVNILAHA